MTWDKRLQAVWDASYAELEDAGQLTPATEALLVEFVFALKGAEDGRAAENSVAEDKAAKRAASLADLLRLSPSMQKKAAMHDDPFAELDELEQRRQTKAG